MRRSKTQKALSLVAFELRLQRGMLEKNQEMLEEILSLARQHNEIYPILENHEKRIRPLELAVQELLQTGTAG